MNILSFSFAALPFVVVFALGLGIPLLMASCYRSARAGMVLIAIGFVLDALILGSAGIRIGINWYLPDLTLGIVAAAALLRFLFAPGGQPRFLAFYVLVVVFFVNLLHGLVVYKTAAGPAARPAFYALVACSYMLTFPMNPERLRALFSVFACTSVALFLLACYRGVVVAADIRELLPAGGSFQPAGHSVWRVIVSGESLILAQMMVAFWAFAALLPGWGGLRLLAPLLLVGTVALQHRSVWLASIAGYAALRYGRAASLLDGRQLLPVLALAAVLGLGIGLAGSGSGSGSGSGLGQDVVRSAQDAVQLRGTAGERLGSWQQLVQSWAGSGPRVWVAGQPYGTRFDRYTSEDLGARRVSYQAHNYYVELLTSQGALSLLSYLALLGAALRGMWRARMHAEYGLAARWLLVMLAFQVTYYLTYGVDYMQALVLGAALSLTALLEQTPKPAPASQVSRRPALAPRAP